nr:glutamate receptor 2.2-like [Ipomoea batatas]
MKRLFCSLLFIIHLVSAGHGGKHRSLADKTHSTVKMGAILDMKTHMGIMLNACMSMALSDFYSTHSDYQRRLVLHTMHAGNALDVASAGIGLCTMEQGLEKQRYYKDNENHQAQALAAICKHFQWRQVVILYEENENGNRFTSLLNRALQRTDILTASIISIPSFAEEPEISGELK